MDHVDIRAHSTASTFLNSESTEALKWSARSASEVIDSDYNEDYLSHCRVANVKDANPAWHYPGVPGNIFDEFEDLLHIPYMRNGFLKKNEDGCSSVEAAKKIENKSLEEQEDMLIEDLLNVLQGIEGEYINLVDDRATSISSPLSFAINAAFDSSIRSLLHRILPVCVDYHTVSQISMEFSTYRHGTVAQAYCSALKILMEEYLTLVCQFEAEHGQHGRQKLSLQKIFLYIQPVQRTMQVLAEICREIEKSKSLGGALLSLLHKKLTEMSGDKSAVELCRFLLNQSSKPYLAMLERWIFAGEIFDPYNEFMIRENANSSGNQLTGAVFDEIDNWEYRYIIKNELCPVYLTQVAGKILNCGKYLNIIFLCGCKPDGDFSIKRLADISDDRKFLATIEATNNYASKALVRLLINQYALLERFRSLKRYFLIDQGDWLLNFLEMADDDLNLAVKDVRLHRLESLMDIAIRGSSSAFDLLKDEIKIKLERTSLSSFLLNLMRIEDNLARKTCDTSEKTSSIVLRGIDALSLRYDAKWPLSILFNRKIMLQYGIIFRRLLQCKYLEFRLSRCWLLKRSPHCQLSNRLMHEMMTFVKNYLYYATVEVLEPNWLKFHASIVDGHQSKVYTIDDALKEHSLFLDDCTKDCLLTDAKSVESFQAILDSCRLFVEKFDDKQTTALAAERFNEAQLELLKRMQILSAASQERLWTDIACRLDLKL